MKCVVKEVDENRFLEIDRLLLGGPVGYFFERPVSTLTAQLFVNILIIISLAVLAQSFGPAGIGTFSLVLVIAQILAVFALSGLSGANFSFARLYEREHPLLTGNGIVYSFVWGAICFAFFFFIGQMIPDKFLPNLGAQLWSIVLVSLIPLLLLEFSSSFLSGVNLNRYLSWTNVIVNAMLLAAIWWLANEGVLSTIAAVCVWIISVVITSAFLTSSVWWFTGKSINISPKLFFSMFPENFHWYIASVLSILHFRFDFILIDHFLTHRDLGYYVIAMVLVSLLWYFPIALARVLVKMNAGYHPDPDINLSLKLSRMTFSIGLVFTVALGLSSWAMIYFLFGESFLPASTVMLVLLPGGLVIGVSRVMSGLLMNGDLRNYAILILLLALLISVILNLLFIPRLRIMGAAMALSISHIFAGYFYLSACAKKFSVPLKSLLIMDQQDIEDVKFFFHLQRNVN